jgi:hypothetical protein
MANTNKSIFYPSTEGAIGPYFVKICGLLSGPLGTKYNTDASVLLVLNDHKTQIPLDVQKAYDDEQISQGSNAVKAARLELAETDMKRELKRITDLSIWEEPDGQTMGIRVEKPPFDPSTVKGKITGVDSTPEAVIIDFVKGRLQGVIIETLEEGSAVPPPPGTPPPPGNEPVWKKLDVDNRSPYEDKRLNKSTKPEDRYYRIRPMMDNKPVGIYSDIVKVVASVYPQPAP